MDFILVPGLWLDGGSWGRVVPLLEGAGQRAHPLTLPGLDSVDTDRSGIRLGDHVDAVVAAIDACDDDATVVVVGHSAGCAVAWAAVDARVGRVAHAAFVGGWPGADGGAVMEGFETVGGDLPMPPWSKFSQDDLQDLDEAGLADFRARSVPSPAAYATDPVRLSDERRYDVPVTAICPEYSADDLREWLEAGEGSLAELAKIHSVQFVDVSTGHWPQLTRPQELADALVAAAAAG